MSRVLERIEDFFIIVLCIICSWQGLFVTINSFLDEFCLLVILLIETIKKINKNKKIKIKSIVVWSTFILLTMLNVILRHYDFQMYYLGIFDFVKIIVLFELFYWIELDDKRCKKMLVVLVIVNIISALFGIYKFRHYGSIGYTVGDKFRDGSLRIGGLSGHPISLGYSCFFVIVIISKLKCKNIYLKVLKYAVIAIEVYALYLTKSRLAEFFCIMYVLYLAYLKLIAYVNKNKAFVKISVFIITAAVMGIVFLLYSNKMSVYLEEDIDNTIRIYALEKSADVFQKYPILGTGIGTFGSGTSIKYNSYVYNEFNFNRFASKMTEKSGNVFESFLAKVIIETGIIGVAFFSIFFIKYLKLAIVRKNEILTYFIICMLFSMILNNAYQIPYVLGIAILLSNQAYLKDNV